MKTKYGTTRWEILKASMRRELTLITRNKFLYCFRTGQGACGTEKDDGHSDIRSPHVDYKPHAQQVELFTDDAVA